jgi:hypothetical protein
MAASRASLAELARPMLHAWRHAVDVECTSVQVAARRSRSSSKAVFESWSSAVPTQTRQWARLFSKLDFEHSRQCAVQSAVARDDAAGGRPGVAKYFGASSAKELRRVFHDFMRDLPADEREELRFVLHAEAIRRGLGKYSITARRAVPVGRQSLR